MPQNLGKQKIIIVNIVTNGNRLTNPDTSFLSGDVKAEYRVVYKKANGQYLVNYLRTQREIQRIGHVFVWTKWVSCIKSSQVAKQEPTEPV